MTVSSEQRSVTYTGNGVTTLFAIPYYFLEKTHILVTLTDSAGVVIPKVLNIDYTVAGAGNEAGGSLTFLVAPPNLSNLIIARNVPATQLTEYRPNDDFPAESHERALDKLTMIAQQVSAGLGSVNTQLGKTVRTPEDIPILPPAGIRAGKLLAFNGSGNPVVAAVAGGPVTDSNSVLWNRAEPTTSTITVQQALDVLPVSFWEFADAVTFKPNPIDPSTWDWGPALIQAAATGKTIGGMGRYGVGLTVVPGNDYKLKGCTFVANSSVVGGVLLEFTGHRNDLDFAVDANFKGVTAVLVSGNDCTGGVYVQNITGVPQAVGGTQSALKLAGSGNEVDITGRNLIRGTSDNDSIPRLLTMDTSTAGTNNRCPRAVGFNVNAGWVTSQPMSTVDQLELDGVTDNGIYAIGGVANCPHLQVYNGSDEPFVASNAKLNLGTVLVKDCAGSSSLSNADVTIGNYTCINTDPSKKYVPFRTRAENVLSSLRVGTLAGEIALVSPGNGAGILQFAAGKVSPFIVDNLDLTVKWDIGMTKSLAIFNSSDQIRIGHLGITLVDLSATLTVADKFDFVLPVTLSEPSRIDSYLTRSAGGDIRIHNAIQPQMQLGSGFEISSTFGPYLMMANKTFPTGRNLIIPSLPTVGSYNRGESGDIKQPFVNGVTRYKYVQVSPGVFAWRAVEFACGRGTTAQRPAVTANDVGHPYFDNTLAANGKPIWWTGAAWVDATGTIV